MKQTGQSHGLVFHITGFIVPVKTFVVSFEQNADDP